MISAASNASDRLRVVWGNIVWNVDDGAALLSSGMLLRSTITAAADPRLQLGLNGNFHGLLGTNVQNCASGTRRGAFKSVIERSYGTKRIKEMVRLGGACAGNLPGLFGFQRSDPDGREGSRFQERVPSI